MQTYESELDSTCIAYSGNASLSNHTDYVQIGGPGVSVWIELVCQNGIIYSSQIHIVWRDHSRDYGGDFTLQAVVDLKFLLLILLSLGLQEAQAHPMPSTLLLLDIQTQNIEADLQIPLSELVLALKQDLNTIATLSVAQQAELSHYLLHHTHPTTPDGKAWQVQVSSLALGQNQQSGNGPYRELEAHLILTPPAGADPRVLTLNYDAVVHQVTTHSILVAVRQGQSEPTNIGVIRVDPVSNTVAPLAINRSSGGLWAGFSGMFRVGMLHIAQGTDHLLFLLTLLLPAVVQVQGRRWGAFAGAQTAFLSIFKIVTAFTIGHSLTLILAAVFGLHVPAQPIEVLIALSILLSALHALRPLFLERETLIAGGFGLIHGMAFARTLAELQLPPAQMAVSLLGFNLGIETVQLLVVALTIPWLLLLARTPLYPRVQMVGAVLALLAALGWLGERLSWPNPLSALSNALSPYGPWLIVGLAVLALSTFFYKPREVSR